MSDHALRLRSLASMAHALAQPFPLMPLLKIAAEEACATLDAASASISCVGSDRGVIQTLLNVGELGPDEVMWPSDETYVIDEISRLGQAVRERKTWTETLLDPSCDPFERSLLIKLGKESSMATPIIVEGVAWGEFYLTRHAGAGPFSAESAAYAEVLAAILGGAVARTLREEMLEGIARRDTLTGLSNRRDFDEHAARMFDVGDVLTRVVAILSIDINGLKEVNDSEGHAQGDVLIRSVGQSLLEAFGDVADVCVARVGGDEFTVIVADHPIDDLVRRINFVCRMAWTTGPHAGISAGLASVALTTECSVTPSSLFTAADRAQYEAKRLGSKDVVVSHEVPADAGRNHPAPG